MDPPCPMHSTRLADTTMSAALRMASGRISSKVWVMASRSVSYTLCAISCTLSAGSTSSSRTGSSVRPAVALAMASLKALYPLYPSRRQKREMVASATPASSASSEMDMNWVRCWWITA